MRHKWLTKGLASLMALTMVAAISPAPAVKISAAENEKIEKSDSDYNYAKAFQESLYFYDANMCGEQDGRLSYRGECHKEDASVPLIPKNDDGGGTNMSQSFIDENKEVLDPDGDGTLDLSGGFHDAGDHVKFGLPQSYSASTLGWSYYEFRDSFINVGEQEHMKDILRHFNDYFLSCTFRDDNGKVVAFAYQIGDGSTDHNYWGAPELQTTARPVWFATSESPASDQCAGAAASLTVNYLNFKDTEPEYAAECLDTAKALYKFARKNRGCGFSGGFYNSSYDEDEMSWAAVWLNIATGDKNYITDITSVDSQGNYTGYMKRIISTTSSTWQNIWVHSWDTVWGGVFAKLAPITNDPDIWYYFRWNIEYWSGVKHQDTSDGTYMEKTSGGFSVASTWGSCRYNAAAQMCAMVYNKYETKQSFVEWAKSQMDYILGDNPMGVCYEVGYDENSAKNPHHRASHGSTTNSMEDPATAKHTLYGALVGGPDFDDYYEDDRTNYVYNEVAIDYNAGFVGALAGLYEQYGKNQKPMDSIPQDTDEKPFYAEAKLEQENTERTQITIRVHNETTCPPRLEDGISVRYFFDISEMLDAGQSIKDISIAVIYDEALTCDGKAAAISKPIAWDEDKGIYYVDISWKGDNFHGKREIQFALVTGQDSTWKTHWDPTNDFSRENIGDDFAETKKIPVYLDGKPVYGEEPGAAAMKPIVSASVKGVSYGDEIDFTNGITPITLNADVTNGDSVSKVEFYVNDEKVGVDTDAPYSVEYTPVQSNEEETKKLAITAKAITSDEITVSSKAFNVTARFLEEVKPVIAITSPEDGAVIDTTKGDKTAEIVVSPIGDGKFTKVVVYADGKKIGEGDSTGAKVTYTAPEGYAPNATGVSKVKIMAEAVLASGRVVSCAPITLTVKQEINPESAVSLSMNVDGKGSSAETTIQRRYTITNNGTKPVDLSKVKIRYYYTKESTVSQTFFCDAAGMNFDGAPYYLDAAKNIKGDFITISGNDCYLEISFADIGYDLQPGKSISIDTRFANSSWAAMDQTNDYSYDGGDSIVMMYDGAVVQGVEPEE